MVIHRGFHPSIENRMDRVHANKRDMPFRGAIFSKVVTGATDSEKVTVASTAGTRTSSFSYPFASKNAWIRGQPEESTVMLSILGGDSYDLQPVSYYDSAKSAHAAVYKEKAEEVRSFPSSEVSGSILPYRVLSPGELDIASKFSQLYFGKRDVFQARGGLSHFTMRSTEARLESPLLAIHGPAHQLMPDGRLSDEIRFGTVRRSVPGTSNPTNQTLVVSDQDHAFSPGSPVFLKEHALVIDGFGTPSRLVDHRQGNVVSDNGKLVTSRQSGLGLRAQYQWYSDNDASSVEIDSAGNVSFQASNDAEGGLFVSVPSGSFSLSSGGQVLVSANKDMNLSSDKRFSLSATEGFSINTQQRAVIIGERSVSIRSKGNINLETPTTLGVKVGSPSANKYPALVAHPDYISTLNNYFASQSTLAGALMAYGINASLAWSSIGPLAMLLDPSGTIMGMCLAAAESASQLAKSAPSVTTAVTQHLPRLSQMPQGFMSKKLSAE